MTLKAQFDFTAGVVWLMMCSYEGVHPDEMFAEFNVSIGRAEVSLNSRRERDAANCAWLLIVSERIRMTSNNESSVRMENLHQAPNMLNAHIN